MPKNHHVKLFIDKDINGTPGDVCYIHHNPDKPSDDDCGLHARGATGDSVKWRSRDDGGFKVEFKTESPFKTGEGAPMTPITATAVSAGFQTSLLELKAISTIRKAFPYTVTFDSGETDDPEIIIDNSSGGGGHKTKPKKKK